MTTSLTWKDLITTLLALIVVGIYWARTKGIDLPLLTSVRWTLVLLLIVGVGMCVLGSTGPADYSNPVIILAAVLGVAALALTVYGLITANSLAVTGMMVTILILWGLATF